MPKGKNPPIRVNCNHADTEAVGNMTVIEPTSVDIVQENHQVPQFPLINQAQMAPMVHGS